jgi:hypothetical protein
MKKESLELNPKQHTVLLISVIIFILSELFPPWQYSYVQDHFSGTCPAGFSFITQAPAIKTYSEMQRICYTSDVIGNISTSKDVNKLWLQRVILALISFGSFLSQDTQRRKILRVSGRLTFTAGLVLLILYAVLLFFIYS